MNRNEYARKWYCKNKINVKRTLTRYHFKRRDLILSFKNRPCADCLGWFNHWQMHFDHRDPKKKKFNIGGQYGRPIKILLREIKKCDVVCANCHANRTYKVFGGKYD